MRHQAKLGMLEQSDIFFFMFSTRVENRRRAERAGDPACRLLAGRTEENADMEMNRNRKPFF